MHVLMLMVNLSMVLWAAGISWDMYIHNDYAWIPVNILCFIYWLWELVEDILVANKTSWWL